MLRKIKKFREFLGPEVWRLYLVAIFVGFLWFAVESLFAYILQGFLSTIGLIPKMQLGIVAELYPSNVVGSVLLLIAFGFFRSTVVFLRYHYANVTSQAFIRYQRTRILRFSLENAHISNTAETVSLFNDRVTESGRVILNFVSIVNLSTAVVLFSILSLWLTPIEFLIGIFILAVALAPIRKLNSIVGIASAGIVAESRKVTHSLVTGLRNNFLLRVYGEVGPIIQSGSDSLRRYEMHYHRYSRIYCLNGSFPHFIGVLAVAIVTFISLNYLDTESTALLAFFYLFFRIAQSASETSAYLNEARVYFTSFRALMDFSDRYEKSKQLQVESSGKKKLDGLDRIDVRAVDFAWPNGSSVFKNLSVSVGKGEMLLVKGESGAGKSTFLSLMCGLLQPTSGVVLYNSVALQELDQATIAEKIGYVGPESYIVEGTLRENLVFAHSHPSAVSESEMAKALRFARLDAEFERNGITLDSFFNEFTQLSTGQKQRLALARAILRRPSLLILDEATANLDADTEAQLIQSLQELRAEMIVLVVSHKNSFDSVADVRLQIGSSIPRV